MFQHVIKKKKKPTAKRIFHNPVNTIRKHIQQKLYAELFTLLVFPGLFISLLLFWAFPTYAALTMIAVPMGTLVLTWVLKKWATQNGSR